MNNTQPHLLVVDDDHDIRELLQKFLSQYQYHVSVAADGVAMREQLDEQSVDLIVMDLMLPGEDGLQLCKVVQQYTPPIPVIMLTALGTETDRIIGLEVGADDYLPKPFNPRELLARIRAVLRRTQQADLEEIAAEEAGYQFAGRVLWLEKRQLCWADDMDDSVVGKELATLSSGEFELLMILLRHPQKTLSRDQLLDMTRGIEASPFDRSIDIQISRLRRKLQDDPGQPRIIRTIRNGGYQLDSTVFRIRR
ncbi:MAG: response regulator [Thiolinea sp.]